MKRLSVLIPFLFVLMLAFSYVLDVLVTNRAYKRAEIEQCRGVILSEGADRKEYKRAANRFATLTGNKDY